MVVVRAKVLGFCMGVRRAVALARAEAKSPAKKFYTLGPLIHNPQALAELEAGGAQILDESRLPESLCGASVIIRAHGVSPKTENALRLRGAAIIDATCPRVKASQLKAENLARAGCLLFLAGEKSHAETVGILGYAEAGAPSLGGLPCLVVGSADEAGGAAEKLRRELGASANAIRTALIAQTTISDGEYRAIAGAIVRFFPGLEIAETICAATRERQESLRELLGRADAVVVAGGKDSANTRRLFAIAEAAGKPCALAETAADVPPEFSRFKTVGLAAGASTPDAVIDAIERALLGLPLPEQL